MNLTYITFIYSTEMVFRVAITWLLHLTDIFLESVYTGFLLCRNFQSILHGPVQPQLRQISIFARPAVQLKSMINY